METKQSTSHTSDKRNWFLRHWIITSFLVLFFIWSIMSWFEEWKQTTQENNNPVKNESSITNKTIENHSVIQKTNLINWNILLEVLISTISKETPVEKIKEIALQLSEKYDANQIQIYCSIEAQKANYSSSFAEEHPDAIQTCYLWEYIF